MKRGQYAVNSKADIRGSEGWTIGSGSHEVNIVPHSEIPSLLFLVVWL